MVEDLPGDLSRNHIGKRSSCLADDDAEGLSSFLVRLVETTGALLGASSRQFSSEEMETYEEAKEFCDRSSLLIARVTCRDMDILSCLRA